MKRKIFVIVVMLLMCISATLINPSDFEVEATPGGGGGGEDEGIGLDFDFMWYNITENLSNVVHNYPNGMIPKGRAWGTYGDRWTADNILVPVMENESGLDPVQKLLIGYIDKNGSRDRNYSSKIVTNEFSFSIDHPTKEYPYETPVPVTEIFPMPSGYPYDHQGKNITHNYTFNNISVYNRFNISQFRDENWPFGGSYNNYSLNVSCKSLNNYQLIVGNVSYLETNDPVPNVQDGMVFMIDDEDKCQDKIDNMTRASGCIIINELSSFPNETPNVFKTISIVIHLII